MPGIVERFRPKMINLCLTLLLIFIIANVSSVELTATVQQDWLYANVYESNQCLGTPFNVTGNRLNTCIGLYQRSRRIGSYQFSSCVDGESATYREYTGALTCTGTPSREIKITGGCTSMKDPNSPDIWHISNVNCYAGDSLPQLPAGMVLSTQYESCDNQLAVAFSAQSTLKCNMSPTDSSFTQLYSLSSRFTCDSSETPHTIGFLGTHCTKRSLQTSLSQQCAAIPSWTPSRYATAESFSCTPDVSPATPSGWSTQTYYDSTDCSGTVLSVLGQATDICTVGYNNRSEIIQSAMTTCDGTYLYDSPDCSGDSTLVNAVPQGSCQRHSPGFGIRFGGSGQSFISGCGSSIPQPYNGHSIVLYQYNNDICFGSPIKFAKLPQDAPYVTSRYTQDVSCSSGSPVMTIKLGSGAVSTFSQYLDAGCSYYDQAYSTQSGFSGGGASFANPLGLAYFSSQQYSACGERPATVTSNSTTVGSGSQSCRNDSYAVAFIAMTVLFCLASIAVGVLCYFLRAEKGKATQGPSPGASTHVYHTHMNPLVVDESMLLDDHHAMDQQQQLRPHGVSAPTDKDTYNPLFATADGDAAVSDSTPSHYTDVYTDENL